MTGLLLVGMSVYERRHVSEERAGLAPTAEGGYPFPNPNGTPRPYVQQ